MITAESRDTVTEKGALRRVLLIDDHPMYCQSLAMFLRALDSSLAISTVTNLADARSALIAEMFTERDFIFVDLSLDGSMERGTTGTLEPLRQVKRLAPSACVVVVSGHDQLQRMRDACEEGASGFISKRLDIDAWRLAIESVLKLGFWYPREVGRPAPKGEVWEPRERQIVAGIARGLPNRDIGAELGLTENTVKWYVGRMMNKYARPSRSRVALLARAREAGVID